MITISIIIPVFKDLLALERCLDSILNQIADTDQIILVDDGSPEKIHKSIEKNDRFSKIKNFKILKQTNLGSGIARNIGLKSAEKQYVWFVDADDFVSKDALKTIKEKLEQSEYDLLFFDYTVLNKKGRNLRKKLNIDLNDKKKLYSLSHYPWNKVIKRELAIKVEYPKLNMRYQDQATIPKIIYFAKKIGYIEKSLYFYDFSHADSISKNYRKANDIYIACDYLIDFFTKKNSFEELKIIIFKVILFEKILSISKMQVSLKDKFLQTKILINYLNKAIPNWRKEDLIKKQNMSQFSLVEKYKIKHFIARCVAFSPKTTLLFLITVQHFKKLIDL